jgi:hypothetical protein
MVCQVLSGRIIDTLYLSVYNIVMEYLGDLRLACEDARTMNDLDESTRTGNDAAIMNTLLSIPVQIHVPPPDRLHLVFPYLSPRKVSRALR